MLSYNLCGWADFSQGHPVNPFSNMVHHGRAKVQAKTKQDSHALIYLCLDLKELRCHVVCFPIPAAPRSKFLDFPAVSRLSKLSGLRQKVQPARLALAAYTIPDKDLVSSFLLDSPEVPTQSGHPFSWPSLKLSYSDIPESRPLRFCFLSHPHLFFHS